MAVNTLVLIALGTLTSFLFISYITKRKSSLRLPPGPKGWPLLGNLFDMPGDFEWYYWATFKDLYGPVSSVTVLGQPIMILNTLKSCNDLLDKNSSRSSGRPRMPFAGELVGWDQQLVLVPYNKHFRAMRKLTHGHIGTKVAAASYSSVQEAEMKYLISRINEKPKDLMRHVRSSIGSILLRVTHGYVTRTDGEDPLVKLIEIAARDFYVSTKPGKWAVDMLPFLAYVPSWFPGASFKKKAAQYRKVNMDQTNLAFQFVVKSMEEKTALPSFVRAALENESSSADELYSLKFAAAAMYGGGLDTMTGYLGGFFLAMIIYPEVQQKAKEELDRVVGPHRLPLIQDLVNLPYLRAVRKEVHRWGTVGPLGLPHCATEDIVYEDHFIPKGSLLLNNIWNIAHDPEHYADPMIFNPDRFMGENPELDPETFVFGFGRRRCPGIEITHTMVFLIMSNALALFNFSHPIGPDGEEVKLKEEFLPGCVVHPKPFKSTIKIRSENASVLVKEVNEELRTTIRVPSSL